MQQNRSKTPWIACGVIAMLAVCGGLFALAGGIGLLAYLTQASEEAAAPVAAPTLAISDTPPAPTPLVAGETAREGESSRIPYESVVQIMTMVELDGEIVEGWSGSGSIISSDGLILTNAHVVLSDRYFQVESLVVSLTVQPDELPVPTYKAELMQVSQSLDIAVIRISTDLEGNPVDRASLNLPSVRLGKAEQLQLGDTLVILGYPSIGGSTITLTRGEVSGFTAEEGNGNRAFIKTSATISGGNSGGLAANSQGELIGIPTQLGYGGDGQFIDCRVLADTNRDGKVDERDSCVPTGGFINALRPLTLASPLIEAAGRGEINIQTGGDGEAHGEIPGYNGIDILFEDDFSDPASGWDNTAWEDGSAEYVDDRYLMTVIPEDWMVWSYLGDSVSDLLISVDTEIVAGTGTGDYGILCRFEDEENFYALEISEDGQYAIWKQVQGKVFMISDWQPSDEIPTGEPFRIDAACIGNNLLLGVNGELLAAVWDDSHSSGSYGLLVGTLDAGNLTVAFDNFVVGVP